jgi:hypothetical protein
MAIQEAPPHDLPEPSDVKKTPVPSGISLAAAVEGAAGVIAAIEGVLARRKNGEGGGTNGNDDHDRLETPSGTPAGVGG